MGGKQMKEGKGYRWCMCMCVYSVCVYSVCTVCLCVCVWFFFKSSVSLGDSNSTTCLKRETDAELIWLSHLVRQIDE